MNIRRGIAIAALIAGATEASAENGTNGYEYLSVPVSVHSAALGGFNATIAEDDISLVYENPALLTNVSDKTLGLGFTSYIAKTTKLSAAWAQGLGERAVWSANVQYLSYGSMKETDETGQEIGKLTASDVSVQGSFAYMLTDYISGGVTAKFMFSNYASYNAFAMGVDLGLNYSATESGSSLFDVALSTQLLRQTRKTALRPLSRILSGTGKCSAPIQCDVGRHNSLEKYQFHPAFHLRSRCVPFEKRMDSSRI